MAEQIQRLPSVAEVEYGREDDTWGDRSGRDMAQGHLREGGRRAEEADLPRLGEVSFSDVSGVSARFFDLPMVKTPPDEAAARPGPFRSGIVRRNRHMPVRHATALIDPGA